MFYALQAVYPGQPVIYGGKPTFIQFIKDGFVWLVGFSKPVRVDSIEAVG